MQMHDSLAPTAEELPPGSPYHFNLDRRKFFKFLGGGLAVTILFQDYFSFAENSMGSPAIPVNQVGAWIHIGEDGRISVFTGKVEVGQNIRTSLSQAVAEELHVPIASIEMVMGDTDLVPFDAGTFGSRSTPQMGTQLRKAAATAREALLDMAAKIWNIDAKVLVAEEGSIVNPQTKIKLNYGALTKGQQLLLPMSDKVQTTAANDWRIAGKSVNKVNGAAFITGRHKYVSDMKLPGMLYGKVLRPPAYKSKLMTLNLSKAKAMPGVTIVHDGDFVGVVAPHIKIAERALAAITATWETDAQPSHAVIFDHLVKSARESGGRNANNDKGEVEQALSGSTLTHNETYYIEYIAHVPLEPRAAVAEWTDGKLTVWTGTQRPFGVQQDLAGQFRIPKEKVRVIMPDTGSGYGGKHTAEAATEAARLAQEVKKPVKVVWTREEEFNWAYFRPAGVIEVKSGFDADGKINAWKFNNYNSGPSGLNTQYKTATQQIAHIPSDTPLKQGSYRGLASTANVFARECHIANMARLAKMDQVDYRLKHLDDERLKDVVTAASKAFRWKGTQDKSPGVGYGIACGFEKGGYVATCAEVLVNSNRQVKILRLVQAFECGAIVNPLHLENQVMGSIVQGLGGALFEAINFVDGKILNGRLSAYRVPRFKDMPKMELITLNRKDLPSAGAGEAAIICVAPAIRNAILDASGVSLQTLPLIPNGRIPENAKPA